MSLSSLSPSKEKEKQRSSTPPPPLLPLFDSYYLSRHPSFSPTHHTITILESTSIASAASGKAGGLLALDWHGEPTTPLASLSFQLHSDLAKQHDGETKWGYRRLEAVHLEADMSSLPVGGDKKDPRGLRGWLGEDLGKRMRTRSLGGKETIAQVHPRLFTEEMVRLSGAKVVLASATSLLYGKGLAGEEKRVVGVWISTSRMELEEVEEEIMATDVVIAAGPWTGVLATRLLGEVSLIRASRGESWRSRADFSLSFASTILLSSEEDWRSPGCERIESSQYCSQDERDGNHAS